jgi:hypothetical protein
MHLSEALPSPQVAGAVKEKGPIYAKIRGTWLKKDSLSLNNRFYPAATVEAAVASAQRRIADGALPPIKMMSSHAAGDADSVYDTVGKLTKVWLDGDDAWYEGEIPNTSAGRDLAALLQGGFHDGVSLYAEGGSAEVAEGEMNGKRVSIVKKMELERLDHTVRPGVKSARNREVVILESVDPARVSEITPAAPKPFSAFDPFYQQMLDAITGKPTSADDVYQPEAAIPPESAAAPPADLTPTSPQENAMAGTTPDLAAQIDLILEERLQALNVPAATLGGALDNLITYLAADSVQEEGRMISADNRQKLSAAHDHIAGILGMDCAGGQDEGEGSDDEPDDRPEDDTDPDGEDAMDDSEGNNAGADAQRKQFKGAKARKAAQERQAPIPQEALIARAVAAALREAGVTPKTPPKPARPVDPVTAQLAAMQAQITALTEAIPNAIKVAEKASWRQNPKRQTQIVENDDAAPGDGPIRERQDALTARMADKNVPIERRVHEAAILIEQALKERDEVMGIF